MGKKFKEFTQEEKDEMLKLHNEGLLNREIAKIFNTSNTMVARLLRDMNITSRHPLLTYERKLAIVDCYKKYKKMSVVADIMKCSVGTIPIILKEFGVKQKSISEMRRKYDIVEDYFEEINTPNKAYALGMIFSDGTVSKNGNYIVVALQSRDKSVLDLLNHEYGGDRKLSFIKYSDKNPNWQDQYVLSVSSNKMKNDLIRHGAIPNKSLSLEFPKDIPQDLIRHFIRGYFDGDGSLSKTEDRCSIVSTESFCKELTKVLKDVLNINSSIFLCHNRDDKPTRTLQIAGRNQVKKFLDWIYDDADIFMDRKYLLYLSKYYPDINNSLSA